MQQSLLLGYTKTLQIGDWVPSQGGYYAGLLTTGTESFTNLDGAGTIYEIYIAEKSVSQSQGQYKNAASCDGNHTYPGTTTASNAEWDGYFNTYTSVLSGATSTHPVFQTVQSLSITVNGTVFDDWYIPAHGEAGVVYTNLKNSPGWQGSSQSFDLTSAGSSNNVGELWTSSGDSCNNTGVLTTAGKWFPGNGGNGLTYGYAKNETATIRPVRRVLVSNSDTTPPTIAITSLETVLVYNSTMIISFDLSESSTDFVVGDITVTNGSLSNFTGSGFAYTALFTPVATPGVTANISVASNSFSDAQGNFNQDGSDPNNSLSINIIPEPAGQQAYTGAGSYQWTAPANVTSVCVVCVGGGGNGGAGSGGGGGGLGWKNNITVVPGQNYSVVVGGSSGQSYFINNTTVQAGGGAGGTGIYGGAGGTFVGDGGGDGGTASGKWAGGGSGGYSGAGGGAGGGGGIPATGVDGAGGGGGGGAVTDSPSQTAAGGGGVGILGQGANGSGGSDGFQTSPGGGGSGGTSGSNSGSGGNYGGGGGLNGGSGSGAVRIIWGSGRSFPSTNTTDQ